MDPNSYAWKRLSALYRALLRRLRLARLPWVRIEALQPRLLMSMTPAGGEIAVSQFIGSQQSPALATDAAGDVVAVWQSQNQDGAGWGVYARRFDAEGNPLGAEFLVNQTTGGNQTRPAVAMDPAGDFVITWVSAQGVDARVFNADGSARTGQEIAIPTQPSAQDTPAVAMRADGGFVVVADQTGGGIVLQQFAATGAPIGGLVQVNTTTFGDQLDPSIAMNASGDFVVAWTDQSSGVGKIQAQQFTASGAMQSGEFLVGTLGANSESNAQVAMDSAGDFVVVWQDSFDDGSAGDIYARRYNSAGAALDGAPVRVNTYMDQVQQAPAVAESSDGRYFITWQSQGEDGGGWGIFGQSFNANGTPDSGEFQINATSRGDQQDPAVAWSGANVVVLWDGQGASATQGIFGRELVSDTQSNQPPTLNVPSVQTTADGTPLMFSSANGDAISMSDADGDGGVEQLTLTATDGLLTLADTAGLSFLVGDGASDSSMTFVGTLGAINAALDGLSFLPADNFNGSASIVLTADDLANTGAGGAEIASTTVAIDVTPGPLTPPESQSVHTPSVTNGATIENEPTTAGLVITPSPADASIGGYFQITGIDDGTLYQADGVTPIKDGNFISFAQGESGLIFSPAPNSAGQGGFSVQASTIADASGLGGAVVAATITIHAPPDVSVTAGSLAYVESQGSALIDAALGLSDPDSGTLAGARVTLIGYVAGQDTLSFTNQNGITGAWNAADGVLTLSGAASLSSYQTALRSIAYADNSLDPAMTLRVAQFVVNDGTDWSAPANRPISLTAINTPPTLSLPSAATLNGNGSLVFSSANGTAIVVGDVDADGGAEQVTLSVSAGSLAISTRQGLSVVASAHSSVLTLDAVIPALNAALATLQWTPAAHDAGPEVLTVEVNDLGQSGAGGALTAGGQVFLTIVPPAPPNIGGGNAGGSSGSSGGSSGTAGSGGTSSVGTGSGESSGSMPTGPSTAAAVFATSSPTISDSAPAVDRQTSMPSPVVGQSAAPEAIAPEQSELMPVAAEAIVRSVPMSKPGVFAREPVAWNQTALSNELWPNGPSRSSLSHAAWHGTNFDLSGGSTAGTHPSALASDDHGASDNSRLISALDAVRRRLTSDAPLRVWAGVASVVTAGLSVAYFLWLARAGSLLSSLLSSMPAWKLVDPLPILDHAAKAAAIKRADDDGLEQLIQDAGGH